MKYRIIHKILPKATFPIRNNTQIYWNWTSERQSTCPNQFEGAQLVEGQNVIDFDYDKSKLLLTIIMPFPEVNEGSMRVGVVTESKSLEGIQVFNVALRCGHIETVSQREMMISLNFHNKVRESNLKLFQSKRITAMEEPTIGRSTNTDATAVTAVEKETNVVAQKEANVVADETTNNPKERAENIDQTKKKRQNDGRGSNDKSTKTTEGCNG